MGVLSCGDFAASGVGEAEIIAAIVGPLANAGASGYATYATSKNSEAERKARRKEIAQVAALRERELELMAKQRQREALVRQAQTYSRGQTVQVGLAAAALVGVSVGVVYFMRQRYWPLTQYGWPRFGERISPRLDSLGADQAAQRAPWAWVLDTATISRPSCVRATQSMRSARCGRTPCATPSWQQLRTATVLSFHSLLRAIFQNTSCSQQRDSHS